MNTTMNDAFLQQMRSIPTSIEPGAPDLNYREIAEKFHRLNRQQLILDIDELVGRHRESLCIATFDVSVEGDEIHWEECEIQLNASVDADQIADTLKSTEHAIREIVNLLQRYCTTDTNDMIASLFYEFGGLHWTPELLDEMCLAFAPALGLTEDAATWLARHRSFRQAHELARATLGALAPPAIHVRF